MGGLDGLWDPLCSLAFSHRQHGGASERTGRKYTGGESIYLYVYTVISII